MSIDIELLWKAWPKGFLPMRGVHTIGGFHCVAINLYRSGNSTSEWLPPNGGVRQKLGSKSGCALTTVFNRENELSLTKDAFLPNVDPSDAATWACLLVDLEDAVLTRRRGTIQTNPRPEYHQRMWRLCGDEQRSWWELVMYAGDPPRTIYQAFYDLDTEDPALALVRARIQLREKEA